MNPRSKVKKDMHSPISTSPLEEIATLEEQQEHRIADARNKYETDLQSFEKQLMQKEKEAIEESRTHAKAELKEYAKTEPSAILRQSEKEAEEVIKALEKSSGSSQKKVSQGLLEKLLSLTV